MAEHRHAGHDETDRPSAGPPRMTHPTHDDFPHPDVAMSAAAAPPSRLRAFVAALALPLAVTVLGLLPFLVLPMLDSTDRAFVWVAADAVTAETVVSRIAADPTFDGGATRPDSGRPPGCPHDALRLHFEFRRVDEAHVAREALERLATASGATVCASWQFEFGRLGGFAPWTPLAASLLMPLALLLALRTLGALPVPLPAAPAAASHHVPARGSGDTSPRLPAVPPLADGTVTVAAVALALLVVACAPLPPAAAGGLPTFVALSLATLPPLVHEAAFRGWLIPRLRAAFGSVASVALSVAASVGAAFAYGLGGDAIAIAGIALACSAMFLRSRSIAAAFALHVVLATVLGVGFG